MTLFVYNATPFCNLDISENFYKNKKDTFIFNQRCNILKYLEMFLSMYYIWEGGQKKLYNSDLALGC